MKNLKYKIYYFLYQTLASHLKLNTETVVADVHWTTLVHDYGPDESFKSVLEVPCRCQDITLYKFMFGGVLAQIIINTQIVYQHLLCSIFEDVRDLLIL